MNKGIVGSAWLSKLVHAHYEENKLIDRHEFFDAKPITFDGRRTIYSIAESSPFREKIVGVRILTVPLNALSKIRFFEKWATHHFIGLETESGFQITIEKGLAYILIQSCPPTHGSPFIWRQRDGVERNYLDSLRIAACSTEVTQTRFVDIIEWIQQDQQLQEIYHLADSNCQHFSSYIWTKVTGKQYPSPANFLPCFPFRKQYIKQYAKCYM